MSLTDLMSGMSLATYPIVGLVIFVGVYAALVSRAIRGTSRADAQHAARIPLDEPGD